MPCGCRVSLVDGRVIIDAEALLCVHGHKQGDRFTLPDESECLYVYGGKMMWSRGEDHEWVDATWLSDTERREWCKNCGAERVVPLALNLDFTPPPA